MKKYVIIGLVVLVGGFLLIKPLFDNNNSDPKITKQKPAANFTFSNNLAAIRTTVIPLEVEVNEELSKIEIIFNDSIIAFWENPPVKLTYSFNPGLFGLGTKTLNLLCTRMDGSTFVDNRLVRVLSETVPTKLTVKVLNTFPHQTTSFTQGLEFYNGDLYEGTGDPGAQGSTLVAKTDIKTGVHTEKMGLQAGYFGEGITILNDTLYQITWKNNKCYTYAVNKSLKLLGEYNYIGEGWGLCNDGSSLIMSNGTEVITFRNPKTFEIERTMEVFNNEGPIGYLNELEFFSGKIYANVWTTNTIVSIDPISGKVQEEIDCTSLVKMGKKIGEVLNGIAYNAENSKIILTGKYWDKLYEVLFVPPGI